MDGLTMDDLQPLFSYWESSPPAHVTLAAVHLKSKKLRATRLAPGNDPSAAELIAAGVMVDNTKKT